jgi:hypothetical protein
MRNSCKGVGKTRVQVFVYSGNDNTVRVCPGRCWGESSDFIDDGVTHCFLNRCVGWENAAAAGVVRTLAGCTVSQAVECLRV